MYELVNTVNGYEITRMKGVRGCYHVNISKCDKWCKFYTFKTIKAAIAFCETL